VEIFEKRKSIFLLNNCQFWILFYCHGRQDHLHGPFLLYSTVALTAATKAETFVFWLRAMQKKTPRYAAKHGVLKKGLSATPHHVTQWKSKPNIFLLTQHYASLRGVTYICEFLCEFATQKWFNPLISYGSGIDWGKKTEGQKSHEIIETVPLIMGKSCHFTAG
jgi:hypothetical protein